jgi:hypothetical protein
MKAQLRQARLHPATQGQLSSCRAVTQSQSRRNPPPVLCCESVATSLRIDCSSLWVACDRPAWRLTYHLLRTRIGAGGTVRGGSQLVDNGVRDRRCGSQGPSHHVPCRRPIQLRDSSTQKLRGCRPPFRVRSIDTTGDGRPTRMGTHGLRSTAEIQSMLFGGRIREPICMLKSKTQVYS